jgi:ubiquinone biosynthesis protein UbiJ
MTISKNDYQAALWHWRGIVSAIASESEMTADEAGEAMALFLTVSVNALKTKVEALEARLEALENK